MANKGRPQRNDTDAIAEALLEQQRSYFEQCLAQIQQVGIDNDEKLTAIHAQLTSLTASLGSIGSDVDNLKTTVESNSSVLDSHGNVFQELEVKLADMEDRNQRCNIHVIGLKEGLEGSNAIQYLSRSLSNWFPQLADAQIDIMRAH